MKAEVIKLITTVFQILEVNMRWMTWNLFLAFIPLVLSVWLFRSKRGGSWFWWLGFLSFYAFLPNAPYLLTDIIHFINDIRRIHSVWMITLVLIPVYFVVIFGGFEAYVISLINLGHYLHRIGKSKWIFTVELITHALCAVGIYWGRFLRFNSWDLITQPDAIITKGIEEILGKEPLIIIALTFIILWGLYWFMKRVTLGFVNKGVNSQENDHHIHNIN
ncbi:DUF1361 domain-containing protein [Aphanizomenon flos-aquae NRERC-008]|uniref:DUF1361 domain-containing protein n=1 Tax=Aphanizomenon flos-aquae FACHB-1249 TaxID=2692889 RepID=A0ABR8INJ3_APHFL|nr:MULTISPECIES: DUF1361 domain-containing protein [Aphanizomenon]MBD2389468.1 DUF1361 domain-containing protein [Aphanizomenon flos-aquae FACHB-1171]MBD2555942.1 DUF1361 domain-containing protein [Aphanizomenon flos-aquae FACHB-1290]MBD2633322.1 DUF1361 domain-containing protein [Aphanizomenon sp. FACHB-1399]MBD2644222.1 DUF1361 domain-containing protein [Aphanizomenon sp. FACHB-1401]MBD2656529.1 DUF1361 domain-containing protein [Aphanizomenon flos-aquae FACHB-1265]